MSQFGSAPIHRRPLIGLALAVTAGMGWAGLAARPDDIGFLSLAATALAAAFLDVRGRAGDLPLYAAVIFLAAAHAHHARTPDLHLGWNITSQGVPISAELVVRIGSDPACVAERGSGVRVWRYRGATQRIAAGGGQWYERHIVLDVFAALHDEPDPRYGEVWHVLASVRAGRTRPVAQVYRVVHRERTFQGSHIVAWCYQQRAAIRRILTRGIEDWPECAAVVSALVLGYRDEMSWDLRETFLGTGTAHVFAISGLHVGLFSAVLAGLLRFLGFPQRWRAAALIPLLGLYTLATGAAVSAVRAFVMASVYWLAFLLRRRPDAPSALALAALLILVGAPLQIAESSFWFSFLVVAGLIGLTTPAEWETPMVDEPSEEFAQGRWAAMARRIRQLALASAVAWVSSTPLTVYLSNQVVPGALLGNLIIIPAAFVIVLAGCCSIWFSIWPLASETFNHAAAAVAAMVVGLVRALFRIPGARLIVTAPPLGWIILIYLVVVALRLLQGWPRRVLVIALATVGVAGVWRWAIDDRAGLAFAPADLSPAILANFPGERGDHLVDPGPAWHGPQLVRWLRSKGVDRLDAIVCTVADAAHAGASLEVVRRIPTRRLILSPGPIRSTVLWQLTNELAALGIPIEFTAAGQRGEWAGGVEWDVWHPSPTQSYSRSTDAGLWLRIARGQTAVLLAGPATERQRECLTTLPWDPRATCIVLDRAPTEEDRAWIEPTLASRVVVRAPASYDLFAPAGSHSWRLVERQDELFISLNFPAPRIRHSRR